MAKWGNGSYFHGIPFACDIPRGVFKVFHLFDRICFNLASPTCLRKHATRTVALVWSRSVGCIRVAEVQYVLEVFPEDLAR